MASSSLRSFLPALGFAVDSLSAPGLALAWAAAPWSCVSAAIADSSGVTPAISLHTAMRRLFARRVIRGPQIIEPCLRTLQILHGRIVFFLRARPAAGNRDQHNQQKRKSPQHGRSPRFNVLVGIITDLPPRRTEGPPSGSITQRGVKSASESMPRANSASKEYTEPHRPCHQSVSAMICFIIPPLRNGSEGDDPA